MRLVFIIEARFIKDANGNIYGSDTFNNNLWNRYLEVFSEITIVARVLTVNNYFGNLQKVSTNQKIRFEELFYYIGFFQFIQNVHLIKKQIKRVVVLNKEARFICRIPGQIGSMAINELLKINKPYAVEVVGDPWDVFAIGSVKHFCRPIIRLVSTYTLKLNVKKADAVLYVTKSTLQKRYPARTAKFTTYASNVKLETLFKLNTLKSFKKQTIYQIISIGSLDQMYKSPDIVIRAINQLYKERISCKLTWIGGGVLQEKMEALAMKLGITHLVFFQGEISKMEVQKALQESDLFVLASKAEGLPRALIEAMALGLPCIGTRVGGIPELLDEEVLVEKGNVNELAQKIKTILTNESFYNAQAKRNLKEAEKYQETILSDRRNTFYNFILENL